MIRLKSYFFVILGFTTSAAFCAPNDLAGVSSPLLISQTTQIPGETLKAGNYSITVLDQLADRLIVRIDSKTSTKHSIFLGVPALAATLGGDAGAVFWHEGVNKEPTLRGFNFSGGRGVEFVFAKAEAVALAKNNAARVVAVDPQSEGRAALKNLSTDELQMVNLWMLSLTTTGVRDKTPAILAQRYEERPQELQVATVAAKEPAPGSSTQVAGAEVQPGVVLGSGSTVRATRRRAVVAVLPHTAGSMPLVWMFGMLSLAGAFAMRYARLRQDAVSCEC